MRKILLPDGSALASRSAAAVALLTLVVASAICGAQQSSKVPNGSTGAPPGGCPEGTYRTAFGNCFARESQARSAPVIPDVFGAISVQNDAPEKFGISWGYDTAEEAVRAALDECRKVATNPANCFARSVNWFANTCNGLAVQKTAGFGHGSKDAYWHNGAGKTRETATRDAKMRCEAGAHAACVVINAICAYDKSQ